MTTTNGSITLQNTLSQLPQGFKLFAKKLNLSNSSLTIDSDKIYVNVVQGRMVSSETRNQ